jgi:hypothetical protein
LKCLITLENLEAADESGSIAIISGFENFEE